MKTFEGLLALFVLAVGMPMPGTGTTPPNAVPFDSVRIVALNWAAVEYPGAKLGTAIPYIDESGNTVAWMFHFRVDGKSFPRYDQVAADVQAERQTLTANTDLSRWRSKYAHVLVSARRDRAPVICFGYGTSDYYAIAATALEHAQQSLGSSAQLSRIYFMNPCIYLEFENPAGQHVVLSQHFEQTWASREAFTGYVTQARAELRKQYPGEEEAAASYAEGRWNHAFDHKLGPLADSVFVPNYGLAPFYDWHYGCSPTSGAMVCGYVDRFQKSGRLVQYCYQRWDPVEGEDDWQIPNIQYELAIDMNTDTTTGGTNIGAIANGLAQVGYDNGYDGWSVTNEIGGAGSDWCWATLTSEINAGHAMVWSVTWESHSLAAFGYRSDKYVYVHNTWWEPGDWWEHSGSGNAHVAAVTPDAGDAHDIRLTYPLGDTLYNHIGAGEVLCVGDTCRITWESGTPATSVDIDVSTDGGQTWSSAAAGVADSGAYHWYIPPSIPSCDSVRLRLSQYNGATLTSADGTIGCFYTVKEAMAPPQLAPPDGLPIPMGSLPVALVVDSTKTNCDSIDFRLIQGLDTIWERPGTAASHYLPDSLLQMNKVYKWIVRGHNQWGWGNWGTPWSFRMLPAGVEEEKPVGIVPAFSVPAVNRLGAASVMFDVRAAAPGSKLAVYDALGNVVRELTVPRPSRLAWDMTDAAGRKLAAGLYFARLAGGATQPTAKLVLLN